MRTMIVKTGLWESSGLRGLGRENYSDFVNFVAQEFYDEYHILNNLNQGFHGIKVAEVNSSVISSINLLYS
jgi:hypothetical protein